MPKIDTPDVRTGFWTAIGVVLALMLLGLLSMLWRRAKGKGA